MNPIPEFFIARFEQAEEILQAPDHRGFRHVVSIGETSYKPLGYAETGMRKLRLQFEDVVTKQHEDGLRDDNWLVSGRATLVHMKNLIEFLRPVEDKILFHCAAGISRSAAAACVFVAMKMGTGHERQVFDLVLAVKSSVWPNQHMLGLADTLLGSRSRLLEESLKGPWPRDPHAASELIKEKEERAHDSETTSKTG